MNRLFFIAFTLISLTSYGQRPSGLPTVLGNKWYKYNQFVEIDSAIMIGEKDTMWKPLMPSVVFWKNPGVDSSLWLYNGVKWVKFNTSQAGITANYVTFSNNGGGPPFTAFNGSAPKTISYNTVGAQPESVVLSSVANLLGFTTTGYLKFTTPSTVSVDTGFASSKLSVSDTSTMLNGYLRKNNAVTSVGIAVPSALSVTPATITTSGTFFISGAGTVDQYIRGDGTLASYNPNIGGGGSSVNYYFNGGTSQGVFSSTTWYQMSKNANTGSGVNFSTNVNGYIGNYITDAGDPAFLNIPAGNWSFQGYFSASSAGGSPSFYIELYKYNGTTFTLLASSASNPEVITNGPTVDAYYTLLSVPATTLAITDRLAIRFYVFTAGRTITMYTQSNTLASILTTFTTGITALNGLTAQVQSLAVGTSGADVNITSLTSTHTINIPTASATVRGALSPTDWTTFNNKVTSVSGTAPIVSSGGTTPVLSMTAASATQNGYLTSANWTTFNNKINISDSATMLSNYRRKTTLITNSDLTFSSVTVNGVGIALGASGTITANTTNALTFNNGGAGAASGTTFNGSAAQTISYNTIGAAPLTGGANYIQNQTATPQTAGFNINGAGAIGGALTVTGNVNGSTATFSSTLTANSFVKIGGTATQFLMANGSTSLITSALSGTINYVPKFTANSVIGNSLIFDNGVRVGVNTTSLSSTFQVNGNTAIGYATAVSAPTNGLVVNGNTLLGTTTDNGTDKLQVNGSGLFAGLNSTGSNSFPGTTTFGAGSPTAIDGATGTIIVGSNKLRLYNAVPASQYHELVSAATSNLTATFPNVSGTVLFGTGTTNYVPKFTSANAVGNSQIFDNGTSVGINTATPTSGFNLDVFGSIPAVFTSNNTAASSLYASVQTFRQTNTVANGNGLAFGLYNSSGVNAEYGYVGALIETNTAGSHSGSLIFAPVSSGTRTERVRITSGGNVGIGTTIPNTLLHAAGSLTVNDIVYLQRSTSSQFLPIANYWNGSGSPLAGTKGDILAIGNAGGDGLVFVNSNIERMRITSAGNIGIGTTSPAGRLTVANTTGGTTPANYLQILGSTADNLNYPGIELKGGTLADAAYPQMYLTNGGLNLSLASGYGATANTARNIIALNAANGISFNTSSSGTATERMRINSSGAIQLTNANPSIDFITNTTTTATMLSIIGAQFVGTAPYNANRISASNSSHIAFEAGGAERLRVTSDGEVLAGGNTDNGAYNLQCNGTGVWGAGAYVNGSDSALKENIIPIDSSLQYVKLLKPVTYRYKKFYSSDSTIQTGFIAQDLMQVFKGKPLLEGLVKKGQKYYSVAYQNLIPIMVKAMQEQQAKIESLEARIAAIEEILMSKK